MVGDREGVIELLGETVVGRFRPIKMDAYGLLFDVVLFAGWCGSQMWMVEKIFHRKRY